MRTVQVRKNYKSWVSESLKVKLKIRDLTRERARQSGDNNDWLDYKRQRNDCTREIKREKTEHFKNIFTSLQKNNDSKRIHRVAWDLLGWNRDLAQKSFLHQGRIISSPKELANLQIDHYSDKMNRLNEELNIGQGQ